MLWRALREVGHGNYIDIGAADPDEDSVTRAFYEAGWRGVNVEPMSPLAERLRHRRPDDINLSVAVGAQPGERAFYQIWKPSGATSQKKATGTSTLDLKRAQQARNSGWDVCESRVEVTTLASICHAYSDGVIHFLKIDAEGSEREVLLGADWALFRPWIVVIEAIRPDSRSPNHAEWEPLLLAADYHFVWFDGLNRFYIAGEHMGGLVRHFQLPLNLFDDFVRHDPEVASHLADARSALATAQAEIVTMGEQLSQTVGERDHAIALNGQQLVELLQLAEECSQQSINAQCLREDYERQLERAESETAALNQTIATMRSGGAVMGNKLEQIALELKWADGPRAIKVVLPAARLLRRLNRIASRARPVEVPTFIGVSAHPDIPNGRESAIGGVYHGPGSPGNTAFRRNWRKRCASLAYRPLRPLVRPLAWRLRTFLTAELDCELRELRELRSVQLSPPSPPSPSPPSPSPPLMTDSMVADLKAFGEAANRLLLTLALERSEMTGEKNRQAYD